LLQELQVTAAVARGGFGRRHGVFKQVGEPQVAQVILQTGAGGDRIGWRGVRFPEALKA
jgi:hypothetical protein